MDEVNLAGGLRWVLAGDIVDPKKYVLEIVPGEDAKPVKLTLADLQDLQGSNRPFKMW